MLMIEVHECRHVAVADVKVACLHADIEQFVLLKFVDEQADVVRGVDTKDKNCM